MESLRIFAHNFFIDLLFGNIHSSLFDDNYYLWVLPSFQADELSQQNPKLNSAFKM